MILNVFALLAGALALLELGIGAYLVVLGCHLRRRLRSSPDPDTYSALESRSYLVFMLASILAVVNFASWPLLYSVLQSYVPEWPGVMCLYGVMRVGLGSVGPSGHLPLLVDAVEVLKPALVFLTGAWLIVYGAHRRSETGNLLKLAVAVVTFVGLVSTVDASAEIAYLAIPKKNASLSSGCCPVPSQFVAAVNAHEHGLAEERRGWLSWLPAAYYAFVGATLLGLGPSGRRVPAQLVRIVACTVALIAIGNLYVGTAFLKEAIAPYALGLPGHHCLYDLVACAPHLTLALALLVWSTLSAGWAGIARLLDGRVETPGLIDDIVRRISRRGQLALFGSVSLMTYSFVTLVRQ